MLVRIEVIKVFILDLPDEADANALTLEEVEAEGTQFIACINEITTTNRGTT